MAGADYHNIVRRFGVYACTRVARSDILPPLCSRNSKLTLREKVSIIRFARCVSRASSFLRKLRFPPATQSIRVQFMGVVLKFYLSLPCFPDYPKITSCRLRRPTKGFSSGWISFPFPTDRAFATREREKT